ncbi:MAG: FkbM family methyltransferase [Pelagibacterales bacterium]|nr:FkbM family methyltransferase [Pelagibacterales bacterium]
MKLFKIIRKIILRNNFKILLSELISSNFDKIKPNYLNFKINTNCPLGKNGDELFLLFDNIITPKVLLQGYWDVFVINFIKENTKKNNNYYFFDIGSHIGLITRQVANLNIKVKKFFCFEPLKIHFNLLKKNCDFIKKINFYNCAIGVKKDEKKIYTNKLNSGNSSLIKINKSQYQYTLVLEANATLKKIIKTNYIKKNIIYKSDTEGYDEMIFLSLEENIIKKINIAILEISNFNFLLKNLNTFMNKIKNFNIIKDDQGIKLNLKTLENKLLLKKGFNLLLCKN